MRRLCPLWARPRTSPVRGSPVTDRSAVRRLFPTASPSAATGVSGQQPVQEELAVHTPEATVRGVQQVRFQRPQATAGSQALWPACSGHKDWSVHRYSLLSPLNLRELQYGLGNLYRIDAG